jgi:hypothetical protein
MIGSDLIRTTNVRSMLEARDQIRERLAQAMHLLRESSDLEKQATGQRYSMLESFFTSGHGHYFTITRPQETVESVMRHIDARFWATLMDQSGIRAFLSARRQSELDRLIGEARTPPFEPEAIQSTFADLHEKRADMLEEGIVDLFRRLSWDYRTNNPMLLGRKIIVDRLLNSFGLLNSHVTDILDDLVRVLHVYDGKPIPEHRHGMYALLSGGPLPIRREMETEYFRIRVYKKGTAHIAFKDRAIPLLDQCNLVIARRFPNVLACASDKPAA